MGRLAWSQVRFRPARTLALIAGVLVAATAFTVLTAASRTAQLRTVGTVSANFVPAYDILVRPRGARTAVENRTGTVQPDFLSGIYGGITMAQYHQIQQVPGVQVAAPIAMVGYTQLQAAVFEPVPAAALAGSGRQLYRISTTWVSDNGASRVAQPPSYLYVTPRTAHRRLQRHTRDRRHRPGMHADAERHPVTGNEPVRHGRAVLHKVLVPGEPVRPTGGQPHTEAGYYVTWTIPVLIAAIDPHAEAKLDGLNKAVVSGSYLKENAGVTAGVTIAGTGLLRQRHERVRADRPAAAHGTVCDA